eukprot:SAG31_NODE_10648_length_1114_cov_0.963547_1_plen_50_part_10
MICNTTPDIEAAAITTTNMAAVHMSVLWLNPQLGGIAKCSGTFLGGAGPP